ncbi:hypothetical protein NIES4071_105810 (plasmid) [Calothrix sp. NIES-4071]|nr:hypothetical protein NIES4071_105810 [Calothrix sp. NIES-4071]BAZ64999.1 hypothetical protein NIES4105_107320 [Calothrix sp. NIES-4105]
MQTVSNKPPITLLEFRQGKLLIEELGLITEFPRELLELYNKFKDIVAGTKVIKGMSDGDYKSFIMFSLIYWSIVRTFPRTIIRNVKKFLTQFYNTDNKSSRDLLFLFNYTTTQRERIAASLEHGVNGIVKDYAIEERSHLEYWREMMVNFGILQPSSYRLTMNGAELLNVVETSEPIIKLNRIIHTESDMCNALLGMLSTEFAAIAASEIVIDSEKGNQLLSSGILRAWFDVHYHAADEYHISTDELKGELHLPHDLINYNMARLAYSSHARKVDFNEYAADYVIVIARMFAAAADYDYQINID